MRNEAIRTAATKSPSLEEYENIRGVPVYAGTLSPCPRTSGAISLKVYSGTADLLAEQGVSPYSADMGRWWSLQPAVFREIGDFTWLHGSLKEEWPVITAPLFGYCPLKDLQLHIEPSAYRLLDSPVCELVPRILDAIRLEKQRGLPLVSVKLTAFVEPEAENNEELVFHLMLNCGPEEALRAWDRLSNQIDMLKKELPSLEAGILDEIVRLDIDWLR